MRIRGKFVGMRTPGTALHVPWDVTNPHIQKGVLKKKAFHLKKKAGTIVVVPPKK